MRSIVVVAMLLAVPAWAANGPWTPAPTPRVGPVENVQPAARAGVSTGAAADAPFSALPTGSVTAGGATSDNLQSGPKAPTLSPQ